MRSIFSGSTLLRRLATLVSLSPCLLVSLPSARAADRPQYNRDVRPILTENCFACHGPDSAARKAGLRLDRRDEAVKAEAVVPGDPDKSGLIERVFSDDPGQRMPPRKTHKTLTAAQKDTLRRWVADGAEYQAHWSLIAPKRPPLPAVKDAGACRQVWFGHGRLPPCGNHSLSSQHLWRPSDS